MHQKQFFPSARMSEIKGRLLTQYQLTPLKQLGTSGYFDTTKCQDLEGRQYILKIRRDKSKETKYKFSREIYVNQWLNQYRTKDQEITFPRYLNSQTKTSPEWLIYYYTEGWPAGGWYNFDKARLNKIFDKLPRLIFFLSHLSVDPDKLEKIGHLKILRGFKSYQELLKKYFTTSAIQKGQKIINDHKKLLNVTPLVLTHGDLHPANIILTPEQKLSLIDWSGVHLNNQAFDAAFLWLELWKHRPRQELFFKKILSKHQDQKEFRELFKINIVRLTPKMLEIVTDCKNYLDQLKKRKGILKEGDQKEYGILEKAIQYYVANYQKIIKS